MPDPHCRIPDCTAEPTHRIRFTTLCSIARQLGVPVTALFISDDVTDTEFAPAQEETTHV